MPLSANNQEGSSDADISMDSNTGVEAGLESILSHMTPFNQVVGADGIVNVADFEVVSELLQAKGTSIFRGSQWARYFGEHQNTWTVSENV